MAYFNQFHCFIFIIFFVKAAIANICDSNDEECTKRGAKEAYALFVSGIGSFVEGADPIKINVIKANLPVVKYQLDNVEVTGFKHCEVSLMNAYKLNSTFKLNLHCPKLELNSGYSLLGYIGDMFVQGEDKFTVKINDYLLMFSGFYEKINGDDGKEHIHIKNYFLQVEPLGSVSFNFRNLFGGDKEKSDAVNNYLNENWKEMDKALRAPALYTIMDIFIENLNKFLSVYSVEEIFPE